MMMTWHDFMIKNEFNAIYCIHRRFVQAWRPNETIQWALQEQRERDGLIQEQWMWDPLISGTWTFLNENIS